MYAIIYNASDYPDKWVMRVINSQGPDTSELYWFDTLEEAHAKVPPGLYKVGQQLLTPSGIYEFWI
jgi:hypothetical protein